MIIVNAHKINQGLIGAEVEVPDMEWIWEVFNFLISPGCDCMSELILPGRPRESSISKSLHFKAIPLFKAILQIDRWLHTYRDIAMGWPVEIDNHHNHRGNEN